MHNTENNPGEIGTTTTTSQLCDTNISTPNSIDKELNVLKMGGLKDLVEKLSTSTSSDKLYEILVEIRSDYSNVDDTKRTGKHFGLFLFDGV